MPEQNFPSFIDWADQNLHVYPLWICPLAQAEASDKLSPNAIPDTHLVVNVGIYTQIRDDYQLCLNLNRKLEFKVEGLRGRKVLYAHHYYTTDEFWQIYDKNWYDALRLKCHATDVFPDIYQKTFVNRPYQSRLFKGTWKLLRSNKKLATKN